MYKKFVIISLVLVYLVIIAGAVVRMTGSGMGCPDWPKCFGYVIPPTEESELVFKPDHDYFKGQVIIHQESLQVSKSDFTSGDNFNNSNWDLYTKHDYAIFNPWHTWIEYINRLAGALAGVAVFIMAILSFGFWKKSKKTVLLSFLAVFIMGFQGWLGATVVYSVLAPLRITLHMIVALLIVLLLIYLLYLVRKKRHQFVFDATFKWGMIAAIVLTLIQIALGTQVRQHVDEQIDIFGYSAKSIWLQHPEVTFYIHRSFSVVVFLLNLFLVYRNRNKGLNHTLMNWIIALIGVEIVTGILMYYFDFPTLSQPIHLIIAAVLFGLQSYVLLIALKLKEKPEVGLTGTA
ncbi:MAG TPA: heme A synthase [Leeuwenhoekiella sp.]|nr:heme A synthase [Leeuwenhoekiella sp.]